MLRLFRTALLLAVAALTGCESMPVSGFVTGPGNAASTPRSPASSNEVDRARQQIAAGQLLAAKTTLAAHLKKSPEDAAAIELLAQAAQTSGDWQLHRASLLQLAERFPDSGTIQHRTGLALLQSARLHRAELRDTPSSAGDNGNSIDQTGHHGLLLLARAVALEPRQVRFAQDYAGALVDHGHCSAAGEVLTQAMQKNPTDKTLPITAARFYEGIGEWSRAVGCYDVALRISPENRLWRRSRAMCHYRLAECELAADDFAIAFRGRPVDGQLAEFLAWGDSCLRTGQIEEARRVFDRIAQEQFRTPDLAVLRVVCRLQLHRLDEARAIVRQGLADWPEHRELQDLAAQLATSERVLPQAALSGSSAQAQRQDAGTAL